MNFKTDAAGKPPLGSAPGRSAKSYSLAELFRRRLMFFKLQSQLALKAIK